MRSTKARREMLALACHPFVLAFRGRVAINLAGCAMPAGSCAGVAFGRPSINLA
jgi:hypothetical protein